MEKLKRFRFFFIMVIILIVMVITNKELGIEAIKVSSYSFKEAATVIPPVFILLGLLDVWVPKDTMTKYMGEGSGIKGIVLSFVVGSAAAGPLYGAFPIAAVFMKKGVKFINILIFIGAWSTTKIPMLLFELSALGGKFAITRLVVDIPGIILMSYILSKALSKKAIKDIYEKVEML